MTSQAPPSERGPLTRGRGAARARGGAHATVTLRWDSAVRVSVEDDGVGFGAPAAALTDGLAGMGERVAALGGRLRLENRPGGGVRVVAALPLPADTAG